LSTEQHILHFAFDLLISVWGIRLSCFLAFRNMGKAEDFRYANWRKEWGRNFYLRTFLQVHMLQGFFMFIIALPIIIINQAIYFDERISFLIYIAIFLMIIAIVIEAIADHQKITFKKDQQNSDSFIQSGLWKFSRHPNYFAEVLFWWSVFLFAFPFGKWFVAIVSPLVLSYLILKVSGIPMLEKKYDDNILYQEYKKKTSAFIPWRATKN